MPYLWFISGAVVGAAGGVLALRMWARRKVGKACRAEHLAQKGQTNLSGRIGGLAHEIKNPLAKITVNRKVLAEAFRSPESHH